MSNCFTGCVLYDIHSIVLSPSAEKRMTFPNNVKTAVSALEMRKAQNIDILGAILGNPGTPPMSLELFF